MPVALAESLADLPYFVAVFGIALLLFTLALAAWVGLVARGDVRLIAAGNVAVTAGLAGALFGFALPLASAVSGSGTLLDLLVRGSVGLLAQLLVVAVLRLMLAALIARMRGGQVASGVLFGAVAVSVGILNAACLTY